MAEGEAMQSCWSKYEDCKPGWKPWKRTDRETLLEELLVTTKKNPKKKGRLRQTVQRSGC